MDHGNVVFFNNCQERDHADRYRKFRSSAFYDLDPVRHAKIARNLPAGLRCIVFQNEPNGFARFDEYLLSAEELGRDDDENMSRVFLGKRVGTPKRFKKISLTNKEKHPLYGEVVNLKGHFKRPSVIWPKVR